jgi:hypothetical protein
MKILFIFFVSILLFCCEKEKVDYRNKIIGDYNCIFKHYYWEMNNTSNVLITEIDTLTVSCADNNKIKILNNTFPIDENYNYNWTGDGSNQINVQFFPYKDSISCMISTGGLGGGFKYYYNGNKIKN